ncbi:hypothetical protein BACCIP111895_03248 [Neobacillus rhizosphaerae]|uniref:DUF2953 domain-containing protein n=1 Tax=Neobacillus rhizosphaerae TaxID=2880965 RepID=A0ABM9ETS2_9BACI|nr:DUF2953 domain-containing protein [Neobacillus rhizosphaerae]CAH2716064.1 hypothetical protein BACCIP111895_03248 [Neobacillus rhizosphaerae]
MFWLLLSLSILLLFFIIIILTKLTILVNYYHYNDNDDLKVEFRVWAGLIKYTINVPLIKIDDDSPSIVVKSHTNMGDAASGDSKQKVNQFTKKDVITNLNNTTELLKRVFNLHVIIRKFFQKVTIKKLEWQTLIGVGDAAYTGMATGAFWAIKGSIVGLLSHYLNLKVMPEISITPHFQAAVIQTQLKCIFQFRIGHAILAGLKLIKFWKRGSPLFKKETNFSNEKTKSI